MNDNCVFTGETPLAGIAEILGRDFADSRREVTGSNV
jgi:hypothetical protein